jgi:hypothetical protein
VPCSAPARYTGRLSAVVAEVSTLSDKKDTSINWRWCHSVEDMFGHHTGSSARNKAKAADRITHADSGEQLFTV